LTNRVLRFAGVAVLLGLAAGPWSAAADRPSVTLDVKDADVREILLSLKRQCGVKNLLIDDDVAGAGTIYFRDVPCETAFKVVFRQFALAGQIEPSSVVTVRKRDSR
jgi:hypothetical protein